jgi:hypothetical protein
VFCPNQIICIISSDSTSNTASPELLLLAETIEFIPAHTTLTESRPPRIWARPLAIAYHHNYELCLRHDLRAAPQLILSAHLFRAALDTEVLPLMAQLYQWDKPNNPISIRSASDERLGHQALHHFISNLENIETLTE